MLPDSRCSPRFDTQYASNYDSFVVFRRPADFQGEKQRQSINGVCIDISRQDTKFSQINRKELARAQTVQKQKGKYEIAVADDEKYFLSSKAMPIRTFLHKNNQFSTYFLAPQNTIHPSFLLQHPKP